MTNRFLFATMTLVATFASTLISDLSYGQEKNIPMIYSTDLYHPHCDPDDHYDLAIIAMLPEFDVKAFIFDLGTETRGRSWTTVGMPALKQIYEIMDRPLPPNAIGAIDLMESVDDKGLDQPEQFQKGVELILQTLRDADEPITMFLVGSCRDFAFAYNRDPDLLKDKVNAVYVNAGNGPDGKQVEWNVTLDPYAYETLMMSKLPVFWCPCFGHQNMRLATDEDVEQGSAFGTYYLVRNQAELLADVRPELKNFFNYMFKHSTDDPIDYLGRTPDPLPTSGRNMWCTGPFLHAAGREIYETSPGVFDAIPIEQAGKLGIADKRVEVYSFDPVSIEVADSGAEPVIESNLPQATFHGIHVDKLAEKRFEPDGKNDCHVSFDARSTQAKITAVTVTGPNNGRWESGNSDRWWKVLAEREGATINCYFCFYANGQHEIELEFDDNTTHTVVCYVKGGRPSVPTFTSDLSPKALEETNVKVFRYTDTRYNEILLEVLEQLLNEI